MGNNSKTSHWLKSVTFDIICTKRAGRKDFGKSSKFFKAQSLETVMSNFVHKFLDSTVGNVFGKDVTCKEPVHHCDDYQPGVLIEFGRTGVKLFKKFLMPCGLCAAVPVMKPSIPPQDCPTHCSNESQQTKFIKPSELPIYPVRDDYSKQMPCTDCAPSALEQEISKIRKIVQGAVHEYRHLTDTVSSTIDTGLEHSRIMLDYLREESNLMPRIGAIGIGGLTGLVLGLRGRTFKRLLYASIGAGTIGAVCYPKQAEEGYNLAKHYGNISLNFIYGVKPGDGKQLEIPLPDLQKLKVSSYSDFLQLVGEASSTLGSAISSVADKALNSLTNKKEVDPSTSESETKKD